MYIYIYIYIDVCHTAQPSPTKGVPVWILDSLLGWHYLSDATCLIRPRLFYVLFVVSRITITCRIIHHFLIYHVLGKTAQNMS